LQCHGEPGKDIQAENLTLLHQVYPDDKATGYKLGDLRGIWRVRFQ